MVRKAEPKSTKPLETVQLNQQLASSNGQQNKHIRLINAFNLNTKSPAEPPRAPSRLQSAILSIEKTKFKPVLKSKAPQTVLKKVPAKTNKDQTTVKTITPVQSVIVSKI